MKKGDYASAVCAEVVRLLTEERERRGISENQLASDAGVSQSFMTRFKSNRNRPNLESLLRIAVALDVDLGSILTKAVGLTGRNETRRK